MIVSVIIPMYNAAPFVGEAIESVLNQSRRADEIVVVDDGSTDESAAVVAGFDWAVRSLRQENAGPAAAVNKALAATRGDVVGFLDADDLWVPEKLALQCRVLEEDAEVYAVFGQIEQFSTDPAAGGRNALAPPQPGISRDTLLIRRSAFERFGAFDATLSTADFVPWYSRAVAEGFAARMLPVVLAHRRVHATNIGIVRRYEQQQENLAGLRAALAVRRARARPDRDTS